MCRAAWDSKGLPVPDQIAGGQRAAHAAPLSIRLATRISAGVDRRLRMAALTRRMQLGHFLDQVLDQALPPVADLADQMKGAVADER